MNVREYAQIAHVKLNTAYKAHSKSSEKLYERSIRMNDDGVRRKVRCERRQVRQGLLCGLLVYVYSYPMSTQASWMGSSNNGSARARWKRGFAGNGLSVSARSYSATTGRLVIDEK